MIALPGEPPVGFDYHTVIREMMLGRGAGRRAEQIFQRALEFETQAMTSWGEGALAHGLNAEPDIFLERSERGRAMFLGEPIQS
jgi:hypothetical protein